MTVPLQEKELVAKGILVAAGCRPSTDGYVAADQKGRATREEIKQAVRGCSRRLRQSRGHEGSHEPSRRRARGGELRFPWRADPYQGA